MMSSVKSPALPGWPAERQLDLFNGVSGRPAFRLGKTEFLIQGYRRVVHRRRFNVGCLPGCAIEQRTQNLAAKSAPEVSRVNDQAIDTEVRGNERVFEHDAKAGFGPLAEKIAAGRADMRHASLQRRKLVRSYKLRLDFVGSLEHLVNLQRYVFGMVIEEFNHQNSTAARVRKLE